MKQGFTNAFSFIAGMAVGAGIEYLLDPDAGKQRRDYYSHALGDYMQEMGDRVQHFGEDAYDRAGETARAARSWATSAGHRARKQADGWLSMHRSRHNQSADYQTAGAMVGTAIGALGLGALLMYAFDPQMGRRRRAMARDQAMGRLHDARDYVGEKARYAAGHAKGYAHEARSAFQSDQPTDQQLHERVCSQLGHFTDQAGRIEVFVQGGTVTLRGSASAAEMAKIEEGIRGVRGVRNVENQLQTA